MTTTIPCTNCGTPIEWTADDLRYHQRRLERGEHAACACDDDCAAEVSPWDPDRLRDAIRAAQDQQ